MTPSELIRYFGSATKAAEALGITKAAPGMWAKRGYIPLARQKIIEEITHGELKAYRDILSNEENNTEVALDDYVQKFRYYSNRYGMCEVKSIIYLKSGNPKVSYKNPLIPIKKEILSTNLLMKSVNLMDVTKRIVYEKDILLYDKKFKKEYYTFKSVYDFYNLIKLGRFVIVGNSLEGIDEKYLAGILDASEYFK